MEVRFFFCLNEPHFLRVSRYVCIVWFRTLLPCIFWQLFIYFFHRCQLCYKSKSDDVCRFACSLFYYTVVVEEAWHFLAKPSLNTCCAKVHTKESTVLLSNRTLLLNSRFEKNQLKLMKNHFTPWFYQILKTWASKNCSIGTMRRQGQLILLTVFHWRTQSIHSSDVFNPWGPLDVI